MRHCWWWTVLKVGQGGVNKPATAVYGQTRGGTFHGLGSFYEYFFLFVNLLSPTS